MPSPPHHKQYTIIISPAIGLPFSHTLSARLPQAVQYARAISSACPLPAHITITNTTGAIAWTEHISTP